MKVFVGGTEGERREEKRGEKKARGKGGEKRVGKEIKAGDRI